MKKTVYTVYAKDSDITFIMEDTFEEDKCVSTEVKGFYWGEPDDRFTEEYNGETKAEYWRD